MDVPQDEHERTLAFAEVALGQIKALGQPAAPRNYEIWYHYATGYNQPLNALINDTLAQKGTLSDTDLDQIYDTYISDSRFVERIDSVGTRVLDEIQQVMSSIDAATGTASNYSKRLTAKRWTARRCAR
jgi:diguanylate cyclase